MCKIKFNKMVLSVDSEPDSRNQRPSLTADILFFPYPDRPSRGLKRCLNFVDCIVSLFIVSPLVVAFWRGTWEYMAVKVALFPNWSAFLGGSILHVIFTIMRERFHNKFVVQKSGNWSKLRKARRFLVTRLYTLAFGIACIAQWKGGWGLLDDYFGSDARIIALNFALLIPLASLRGLRNLLAPPMIIITDKKEFTFTFPTRFRTEVSVIY